MPNPRPLVAILQELVSQTCPSDFAAFEAERLARLQKTGRFILKGHPVRTALALAGGSRSLASFYRQVYSYRDNGIDGLRSKYANCGRPRALSPAMLKLVVANLALRAVQAELRSRIGAPADVDSTKVREAAAGFLRAGKLAALKPGQLEELILDGLLTQKAHKFPRELREFAEQIESLAARALFPGREEALE